MFLQIDFLKNAKRACNPISSRLSRQNAGRDAETELNSMINLWEKPRQARLLPNLRPHRKPASIRRQSQPHEQSQRHEMPGQQNKNQRRKHQPLAPRPENDVTDKKLPRLKDLPRVARKIIRRLTNQFAARNTVKTRHTITNLFSVSCGMCPLGPINATTIKNPSCPIKIAAQIKRVVIIDLFTRASFEILPDDSA